VFTFPYPVPDSTFSAPLRWGTQRPSAAYGVPVTVQQVSSGRARLNLFGYQASISGTIAAAAAGTAAVLELFAGSILVERIVHGFNPFRPAPATGGPVWVRLPTLASITAQCTVPVVPAVGDVFEARVYVWGFEEF